MTPFYSHQDRFRDSIGKDRSGIVSSWQMLAKWPYEHARRTVSRTSAIFKIVHQAIVTAKTRRLQHELMFHAGWRDDWSFQSHSHESYDADAGGAKFPQRPLILGDKWDF
jgi:hypothetical protein